LGGWWNQHIGITAFDVKGVYLRQDIYLGLTQGKCGQFSQAYQVMEPGSQILGMTAYMSFEQLFQAQMDKE
jgi:hypothetical protein